MSWESASRRAEALRQGRQKGLVDMCSGCAPGKEGSPKPGQCQEGSGGAALQAGYRLWPRVKEPCFRTTCVLARDDHASVEGRAESECTDRVREQTEPWVRSARSSRIPSGGSVCTSRKSKERGSAALSVSVLCTPIASPLYTFPASVILNNITSLRHLRGDFLFLPHPVTR